MTQTLTIRRPDDWHLHLRDGDMLRTVAPCSARQFARAIIMPNLVPPVTTPEMAAAYRDRIRAALPGADFTPLMTCYLTDLTDPDEVSRGHAKGVWTAAKLYPAGATTNSQSGVTDVARLDPVLGRMAEIEMPLLVHGEVTDPAVDIFDREAVFLDRVLEPLLARHPGLKVVLEHVTTADGVSFVEGAGPNVAGTITPHHLHLNRNALFQGGLRPHAYCLPVVKRERHRQALVRAATGGSAKFFAGTDSAPHSVEAKESACGCAGIWNAPRALESYLAIFEAEGAPDRFEAFVSENGARFYGLPLNEGTITLERAEQTVPERLDGLVPFHAGETLGWTLRKEASSPSS